MRRLVILALLFGGIQLVLVAGPAEGSGEALLAFGFLILAAYSVGELMKQFNLPKLVGYLVAGAVFGPSALAAVPADAVADLAPVSDLAIALIAFLAGAELEWGELRRRGIGLLKVTGTELAVTFLVIAGALVGMREFVPFLQGTNTLTTLTFAGLFASIAIVHSPAVTMALLSETGARGPVSRTTLGVVLLADVVVVLLFSAALSAAQALVPSGGEGVGSLAATAWEIGGAIPIGALLGGSVALYLRFVRGELFLFALLVTFFGLEISRLAHVETLLTLLVAGFVAETAAPGSSGRALRHAMERSAAPVFVVFFALAGAKLQLAELLSLWPVVIPIVLVRALGIWTGTRIGARIAKLPRAETDTLWMGLISQAGVAIGLVTVAEQAYPAVGGDMRTILLSVIAVNETVGAVLFRRSLARAGEINARGPAGAGTPLGKRPSGAMPAPSA
jgi:Kef-type K+ transport system membrane component KefB